MMQIYSSKQSLFPSSPLLFFFFLSLAQIPLLLLAREPHLIDFRSPNLYPEGLAWDPKAHHFLVGSLRQRVIAAVSDAGVVETLIYDPSLPENVTVSGLAVDTLNNRLLACLTTLDPLPPFTALAAYDLRSGQRIFLSLLPTDGAVSRQIANDVAVDFKGNAYVTNSVGNYIWKVNENGEASVFSKSPLYTSYPVDPHSEYSFCGLNGIAFVSKGYLLVVQSNTGKMFKVDADDGRTRTVLLNEDLSWADGIAIRSDGVVLVVSTNKLWYLKSQDSWGEGVVYDRIVLDEKRFPTSVVVGAENRVYVLFGHLEEGIKGNEGRESFQIEEIRSEKERREDEDYWIYILVGFALAYFLFWRFQMRQLVKNMDKKTN